MVTIKDYLKVPKKSGPGKVVNIEHIQAAIESVCPVAPAVTSKTEEYTPKDSGSLEVGITEEGGIRKKRRRCTFEHAVPGSNASEVVEGHAITTPIMMQKPFSKISKGKDNSIKQEIRPYESTKTYLNKAHIKIEKAKNRLSSPSIGSTALADNASIVDRKLKVVNYATRDVLIPYSLANATRFLPKSFKLVAQLYKILETTFKFNSKRGLSLVLVKYKESIERLFRHRLEHTHLEQLHFIAKDDVEFIPVRMSDKGEMVDTFSIKILKEIDIDLRLYEYFMDCYRSWLDREKKEADTRVLHKEFDVESVILPCKELIPQMHGIDSSGATKTQSVPEEVVQAGDRAKATSAASTIYERIKERERLRKEAFLSQKTVDVNYNEKIDTIFAISRKRAIKLDDLIFQLDTAVNSKQMLVEFIKKNYTIKIIDQAEYVIGRH